MFELTTPKGARPLGRPTKQLRTRSGPTRRPARPSPSPGPRSSTHSSPSRARSATLRAGHPECRWPVRVAAERTKRGRPSVRGGPDHFRAAASTPPTPPAPGHTLSPRALCSAARLSLHRTGAEQVGPTMRPTRPARRFPKLGCGRIPSPTYIFPPPPPPPALLSR
jgi:hypothetical protein